MARPFEPERALGDAVAQDLVAPADAVAPGRAVLQRVGRVVVQHVGGQPLEVVERERRGVGQPGFERPTDLEVGRELEGARHAARRFTLSDTNSSMRSRTSTITPPLCFPATRRASSALITNSFATRLPTSSRSSSTQRSSTRSNSSSQRRAPVAPRRRPAVVLLLGHEHVGLGGGDVAVEVHELVVEEVSRAGRPHGRGRSPTTRSRRGSRLGRAGAAPADRRSRDAAELVGRSRRADGPRSAMRQRPSSRTRRSTYSPAATQSAVGVGFVGAVRDQRVRLPSTRRHRRRR